MHAAAARIPCRGQKGTRGQWDNAALQLPTANYGRSNKVKQRQQESKQCIACTAQCLCSADAKPCSSELHVKGATAPDANWAVPHTFTRSVGYIQTVSITLDGAKANVVHKLSTALHKSHDAA